MIQQNKTKNRITSQLALLSFIFLSFTLFTLINVNNVNAYQRLCLGYGEGIPGDDYVCWHTKCQVCVTDQMNPTHPGYCNDIKGCSNKGSTVLDITPPSLTVNSPSNNAVYNVRNILFDIRTNEPATYYYLDNINGRGRWKSIGSNTQSISKTINFKDGLNDITIKAVDRNKNENTTRLVFTVDSKEPKITKTFPKKGFANGDFNLEFIEENPVELVLHYGNSAVGFRQMEFYINECETVKSKKTCEDSVVLSDFNEQDIEYWFVLEDIAESVHESKHLVLSVDSSAPVLLNPASFWSRGQGKFNKYIQFNMEINEPNLEEVSFIDNSEAKPKYKKICSSLKDGKCVKKQSFKKGTHALDVRILDKAGNSFEASLGEFVVV